MYKSPVTEIPWTWLAIRASGITAWGLLTTVVLWGGLLRLRLGKVGDTGFKRSHFIAYAAWPFATAHYVLAGTDALSEWSMAFIIAGSALLVFGLLARGFVPAPAPARPVRGYMNMTAIDTNKPAAVSTATTTRRVRDRKKAMPDIVG